MQEIYSALGLEDDLDVIGREGFTSCFPVSTLAAHAIGSVGVALAALIEACGLQHSRPAVAVNKRLASLWFKQSVYPVDWKLPPLWDAVAGDYRAADGWIKLHTNLPHHRKAACDVLGVGANRPDVERAVARWRKDELESAVVAAGGVAAAMRSRDEWAVHPQGDAVAREPLISWGAGREGHSRTWPATLLQPLSGIKVLDLTRVLAGPVATRTLAGFGADVLRLDPPDWEEVNVEPEVTLGKRCARLDLRSAAGRKTFRQLLQDADILVHGYRPGALDGLGFGAAWRREAAPHLIEVSLCAYGWAGPWAGRRGFDSLVQMSSGISDTAMLQSGSDVPTHLPVQALDHATGYLMAAAVIRSLANLARGEAVRDDRLSLARTAKLLVEAEREEPLPPIADVQPSDFAPDTEGTPWGAARRLASPLKVGAAVLAWDRPASQFGSSAATWAVN